MKHKVWFSALLTQCPCGKVQIGTGKVDPARKLPSKQKLELKSSKTRLLPSRSGVLIEFQSGVFTGNSRAISGLNSSFHQVDICVISGWYLGDIWMIFGWYLDDMWVVKTGIQKGEFKSRLCTKISPSW